MFSPVIFGRISNVVLVSFLSFLIITVDLFVNHASMDICAVMPGNLLTVGSLFVHIKKILMQINIVNRFASLIICRLFFLSYRV